ncbi:MAG: RNA-binding S4 domain-containing protein [Staphylococcus sp.]|nr:RNA-binding S4 domain-containing protein [Staphylococcus sp.]
MKVIKIKTDYIKLGQFLKFIGMISLGGEVKDFLANKTIKINNLIEKQRGKKLFSGDLIEI